MAERTIILNGEETEFEVRVLSLQEVREFQENWRHSFRRVKHLLSDEDRLDEFWDWRPHAVEPSQVLGLFDRERPMCLGMLAHSPQLDMQHPDGPSLAANRMAVRPNLRLATARTRGIGTELIRYLVGIAFDEGYEGRVWLPEAVEWKKGYYESLGFEAMEPVAGLRAWKMKLTTERANDMFGE